SSSLFMSSRFTHSTLFPYTTLFRSVEHHLPQHLPHLVVVGAPVEAGPAAVPAADRLALLPRRTRGGIGGRRPVERPPLACEADRSEEHTSELQSRENLVCRLLLEKK